MPNDEKAADLIRRKIHNLHSAPDTKQEIAEVESIDSLSNHQKFLKDLVDSKKDIATIQTEWHNYYLKLDEQNKKQVWDEFYASNKNLQKKTGINSFEQQMTDQKNRVISKNKYTGPSEASHATTNKRLKRNKLKLKHHIQSLLFGLSLGILVIFIFMFSFFNEVIIAPLIQPSRNTTAVPIILGGNNFTATSSDQVIIPKINVEIPVNYGITTTNENTIENFLEDGVIHYPTTVEPGQYGNAAFFGHSSNNIFNPGKYKFAFVLLHTIVKGDTFYLTFNHTLYVYQVISRQIVNPNDVSVLNSVPGQSATATLITCDPPGTSLNRLVVVGKQISPSVSADTQSTVQATNYSSPTYLPGNGPTLWSRFIHSSESIIVLVVLIIIGLFFIFRKLNKRT